MRGWNHMDACFFIFIIIKIKKVIDFLVVIILSKFVGDIKEFWCSLDNLDPSWSQCLNYLNRSSYLAWKEELPTWHKFWRTKTDLISTHWSLNFHTWKESCFIDWALCFAFLFFFFTFSERCLFFILLLQMFYICTLVSQMPIFDKSRLDMWKNCAETDKKLTTSSFPGRSLFFGLCHLSIPLPYSQVLMV